jgi:hypothetical protein
MLMNYIDVVMIQMKRVCVVVMVVDSNLMGSHHMQVISEIDQVAIQTDGKYIETQKQRKDRSGFSDHS